MIEKNNFGFPFNYGDTPCNDGNRLSDKFVTMVKTKKFQNICSALIAFSLYYGGQVQAASAIPPEAGEHVAKAAETAVNGGEAAKLAADTSGRLTFGGGNPPPVQTMQPAPGLPGTPGGPGGPPGPGQPPIYMPLARPVTPVARTANSVIFTGSFAWICVNAYWGNPVALAGCSIMVLAWFANVLGIHLR